MEEELKTLAAYLRDDTEPTAAVSVERAAAMIAFLVRACEFALLRFCDPAALAHDPAAVLFKRMVEEALALAKAPLPDDTDEHVPLTVKQKESN